MLSSVFHNVEERLTPMILEALKTQSFGVEIMSWEYIFVPQVATEAGPRPAFGAFYQCRGRLIGTDNYLSQITVFTDPFITQEGVNEAIGEGCSQLRELLLQQGIAGDGRVQP
jgi:hypothetical protein